MTVISAMLMIGEPSMMMAPYEFRLGVFIMATVSVSMFMGNIGVVLMKYFSGQTPTDSLSEIINLYFLVLQLAAFIPSVFIFLFDGLAFSPYSIFNRDYGDWADIELPGQNEKYLRAEAEM